MRAAIPLLLLLSMATTLHGQWLSRTYSGGFSTHWSTRGLHGHNQEMCPGGGPHIREFEGGRVIFFDYVSCDDDDFARANLDDSFGSQLGYERVRPLGRGVSFVAALDASVNHTEFNLSQRDFAVISAAGVVGLEAGWKGLSAGIRYGVGPSLYDDRFSTRQFTEGSLTVPLSRRLGVRFSRRFSDVTDRQQSELGIPAPRIAGVRETAVLLVMQHGESGAENWTFSTSTGVTQPGTLGGRRLGLGPAAFQQYAIERPLTPSRPMALHFTWTVTEHESLLESEFLGYRGNYRGKTVNTFGAGVTRVHGLFRGTSFRYGGGVEGGIWSDEHRLLVDAAGNDVRVDLDAALTARATVRFELGHGIAAETGFEHARWLTSGMAETRTIFGLVLHR